MAPDDATTPTLGNYELLTRLATGGMAEIFLAREKGIGGLERLVVIKRIKREYAEDPSFTEMFLREARIVARINDPNVVQIFELGEEEGDYYISMEFIHGLTIAELIKAAARKNSWFPLEASVAIMEQACKGLHQVHEVRDLDGNRMGLIHRDVSHQNFMCSDDGNVKLIDFGIAKSTKSPEEATYSGSVKGKYAYMSPEQCSRDDLDRRSDIFSLGVVAWELFAGKRLFKRQDKLETVKAITQEEVPPPSSNHPAIPPELERAVMRALRKDPGGRFQTAEQFRQALVDGARTRGLDVGPDQLGRYVDQVASDELQEKRRELREAVDRNAESGLTDEIDLGGLKTPAANTQQTDTLLRKAGAAAPMILAVAGLALLVATGWYVFTGAGKDSNDRAGAAPEPKGPAVTVGWPPIIDQSVIEEETAPIWRYLEGELDRPVELTFTTTYDELSERLRSGELQFAMLPPLLYVKTKKAEPRVEPLVAREFDGAVAIDGVILIRGGSEMSTLDDLKGKRVCFTDRNSTTGNFLPRAHLREKGHDPDVFLGPPQWSGSHVRVLRDLLAGRCDAAATSSAMLLTGGEFGIPVGKLRTLAVTGHVPQDVLAAAPEAPEELSERIKTALLEFDPEKAVGKSAVSDKMKITGFSEISNDAYSDLRDAVRAAPEETPDPDAPKEAVEAEEAGEE